MTRDRSRSIFQRGIAIVLTTTLLAACAVGPTYERPAAPVPAQYKEGVDWVVATPADALERGPWWTLFNDSALDELEARVDVSNQNVAAAVAAYDEARAFVREQRAALFPVVALTSAVSRAGAGDNSGRSNYQIGIGGTWEPDVWGRLRRTVEVASTGAQASFADLAAARLAAQGELAINYIGVRHTDAQRALLAETIAGYERSLRITQNRYDAGIVAKTDVLQAQTQLATSQAEALGLNRQRAQFEHAIAVLVGVPPADFSLPERAWNPVAPEIPIGVPSTLLQRRPDIAATERLVAQANERIGIAQSAYYPSIGLSGSVSTGGMRISDLFSVSSLVWSVGASLAQTLFNAGATREAVAGTRAAYNVTVAQYRQTVLFAFQNVEDQLIATRVLQQQQALRRQAADAAENVQTQILNRYRAGQVSYTDVVVAQVTTLNARRALIQLIADQHTTAVSLIQSLGGGWQGTP
jgi:NodT family efflux transporter outer membrane factor (OMF) lipoprotein